MVFQCFVISVLVVAVRMFFPPEKVTMMRLTKAMVTSVFIAVLVAYYALEQGWTQNKIVISIMLGAFLADDAINLLLKSGLEKVLRRFK